MCLVYSSACENQLIRFSYATNMSRPNRSGSCRLLTKSKNVSVCVCVLSIYDELLAHRFTSRVYTLWMVYEELKPDMQVSFWDIRNVLLNSNSLCSIVP